MEQTRVNSMISAINRRSYGHERKILMGLMHEFMVTRYMLHDTIGWSNGIFYRPALINKRNVTIPMKDDAAKVDWLRAINRVLVNNPTLFSNGYFVKPGYGQGAELVFEFTPKLRKHIENFEKHRIVDICFDENHRGIIASLNNGTFIWVDKNGVYGGNTRELHAVLPIKEKCNAWLNGEEQIPPHEIELMTFANQCLKSYD